MNIVHDHIITVVRPNGSHEHVRVSVIVDTAAIARELGPKATRNRSGRSKILGGAVIVTEGPQK